MNAFDEFLIIIKDLQKADIQYALVGGVAMAFHDVPRFTEDIDLLIKKESYIKFKDLIEEKGYFESAEPWTFKNIEITLHRFIKIQDDDSILIDVLVPTAKNAEKIIDNADIAESDKGVVKVASKVDLAWLKSFRNSKQDQADIERLKDEKD